VGGVSDLSQHEVPMKRIKKPWKVRRTQSRRSRYALRKRRRRTLAQTAKRRAREGRPKALWSLQVPRRATPRPGTVIVEAPEDFTCQFNPEECNRFVAVLRRHLAKRNVVQVSLFNVARIDSAAILILLSVMIRFKAAGVDFGGDFPKNAAVRDAITKSGFFQGLYRRSFDEQETYSVSYDRELHTHAEKQVNSELTAEIVEKAATTVWGEPRRCPGVQRILLELMQNTNNHASLGAHGEKHWWLSVYHQRRQHRALFTFVDFGVGVFASLDSKGKTSKWYGWRNVLYDVFWRMDNAEVMNAILDGRLHETITKQSFRGKGLPGIREVLTRNGVSKLLIITNDVYADVGAGRFQLLKVPFEGTLVVWEVEPSNVSFPA
jgi:hypothetical protein